MNRILRLSLAILLAAAALAAPAPAQEPPPSPSEHLGFEVGADRTLADYRQIRGYFETLAEASPRVALETVGRTTLGEEMVLAAISSEANLANLDRIREISARLADPRGLSDAAIDRLAAEGKAVLMVICNIHATEIGSSQMAMEWAHALATAEDAATRRRLDEVVVVLVPSANPDGQIMETEWYRRWLGTPWEGGRMPWLYHHYVGHDNNRDWFMLTQAETRALNRAMYHRWFPQIVVDEHQMGDEGPRMFVPPFSGPMDPDVHPLVFREIDGIGTAMALRLEQAGKAGVAYGYSYDAYWIGGTRNTPWWKNVVGVLTEIASADLATPKRIEPTELEGGRKGLVEYGPRINHPNPWTGGWWRLRDILDYGRIASDAALEWVAEHREDVLRNMAARARATVEAAAPGEAYRIPADQRDAPSARRLAALLAEHGAEVRVADDGDVWVPLAQPYARLLTELLEPQRYPETRLAPGGEPLRPYDVTAWTLPLMMGVEVERTTMPPDPETGRWEEADAGRAREAGSTDAPWHAVDRTSVEAARVVNAGLAKGRVWLGPERAWLDRAAAVAADSTAREAGVGLVPAEERPAGTRSLREPRIGIYQPWGGSMDEGWTRWVLETYGFEPAPLRAGEIRAGGLAGDFDAIVLPDIDEHVLETGRREHRQDEVRYVRELPPGYRGGLEEAGERALRDFVETGGTLIAFDSATDWVIGRFDIPVRNALAKVDREAFSAPGALLRTRVSDHPVTAGLPAELPVLLDDATAFETTPPGPELERWVLARYPADARDIRLSGWIRGAERLERRAAAVATTFGEGKLVLIGFRPQFRGQTHVTFPLLFNAVWWATER